MLRALLLKHYYFPIWDELTLNYLNEDQLAAVLYQPYKNQAMYLLDTNIVSELRKVRPHGAVVAWIKTIADAELFLSVVTLGEIQAGIEMTRKQNVKKAAEIETWIDQVAATYNILPMESTTFRLWAKLMHRQSNTVYEDAMIAATAILNKLTVVTRNIRDFERFQVPLFNPFGD